MTQAVVLSTTTTQGVKTSDPLSGITTALVTGITQGRNDVSAIQNALNPQAPTPPPPSPISPVAIVVGVIALILVGGLVVFLVRKGAAK